MKNITPLFGIVFLMISPFLAKTQDTVYVSKTNGNDNSGNGSIGSPYRTIAKGVAAANTNTLKKAVIIDSGTYREVIDITISKSLTVKTKGNGPVIIDATDRGLTPEKYIMGVKDAGDVVIDGIIFQNCRGLEVKGIYIQKTGTGVNGANGNIEIRNCVIRNISWNQSGNFTDIPTGSLMVANAIRVQCGSQFMLTDVRLVNNQVYDCATGRGEAITIVGNVNGFLVYNNKIFRISNIAIDAAGNWEYTGAPNNVNQARNGVISANEVYDCMSPVKIGGAIYLDGSANCTVSGNVIRQSSVGISVGAEEVITAGKLPSGGHKIYNNLIFNNSIAGMYLGSGTMQNFVRKSFVYNNTLFKNGTAQSVIGITVIDGQTLQALADGASGEVILQNIDTMEFRNNIVYPLNNRRALVGGDTYTVKFFRSNFNNYFRETNSIPLFIFYGTAFNNISIPPNQSISYNTVEAFTTSTQMDVSATFGDPKFVNGPGANFRLRDSSIYTINKGDPNSPDSLVGTVDVGNSNRIFGSRIDIGAYEFQGTPILITSVPSLALPSDAIKIFTNPVIQHLQYQSTVPILLIEVTDATGRRLTQFTNPNGSINMATLPAGVYGIKFFPKKYAPLIKRVVKQ